MKRIEAFEHANSPEYFEDKLKGYDKCYRAYHSPVSSRNRYLVFREFIFESDVPGIVETLKSVGLSEFVIVGSSCGILDVLAKFQEHGCRPGLIVPIPDSNGDPMNGIRLSIRKVGTRKHS